MGNPSQNNPKSAGRPEKFTVDYFPHDCVPKTTISILERKFQNDGYAFWYKLLELLGSTENHWLNLNIESETEKLSARMLLDWDVCEKILDLLSKLDAIDKPLWSHKIVWCDKFVKRLIPVYDKRHKPPLKPDYKRLNGNENNFLSGNSISDPEIRVSGE